MIAESANLNAALCPICGGTGWAPSEGKGVRPCPCKFATRGDEMLRQSKIPKRYENCSFQNFELLCPSLQRAMMTSRKFVEDFPDVNVGLLYLGRCGVGKTHLAVAALKEIMRKKGLSGLFYDFRDLLKEIQDSYNPNTHSSELKVLTQVIDAEMLVLDELGANKPSEWVQETITYVITKRYNDKKITIFTSNYLDITIGSAFDETLTDRVGVRLRSRLHEMCRQVLMEGDDYREIIKDRRGTKFR